MEERCMQVFSLSSSLCLMFFLGIHQQNMSMELEPKKITSGTPYIFIGTISNTSNQDVVLFHNDKQILEIPKNSVIHPNMKLYFAKKNQNTMEAKIKVVNQSDTDNYDEFSSRFN